MRTCRKITEGKSNGNTRNLFKSQVSRIVRGLWHDRKGVHNQHPNHGQYLVDGDQEGRRTRYGSASIQSTGNHSQGLVMDERMRAEEAKDRFQRDPGDEQVEKIGGKTAEELAEDRRRFEKEAEQSTFKVLNSAQQSAIDWWLARSNRNR